jgi:hypothetical protein
MHAARLTIIATFLAGAGCSGAQLGSAPLAPQSQPLGQQSGIAPESGIVPESGIAPQFQALLASRIASEQHTAASGTSGLYVSDDGSKSVEILANKTYSKIGTITAGLNGPDGDWIDAGGNLYVANYKGRNVTEYKPGRTQPACTYSSGLRNPINVTTDASGNVFVVDWNYGGRDGKGYVVQYAQCVDTVVKSYVVPGGAQGAAIDSSGNVFASYLTSGPTGATGALVEFTAGSSKPKLLGATYGYPGGMVIDKNGNLLVCDQTHGELALVPPPYSAVSANYSGFSGPFHVALTQAETLLFIADPVAGKVDVLTYPLGILKKTLGKTQGLVTPFGVSDAPNAVF